MSLNLITDVPGLSVGNAHDTRRGTGATVILIEQPNAAAVVIRGGAPGSRDTAALDPEMTGAGVHAFVLSGGSAFGLDAAGGVMAVLRARGIGFRIGATVVPIVPQAIIFDLLNGGDKDWGMSPPYWELGRQAAAVAATGAFLLGTVGGGYGAATATYKGGLGSASQRTASGFLVGAIAVVNAVGTATIGTRAEFWAGAVEQGAEFGGLGMPQHLTSDDLRLRTKGGGPSPSTTIALVATDAILTGPQAKRLAIMADDGLARAIRPAHAPMDGDTVFACATQRLALPSGAEATVLTELGMAAGDCLARAIARGVYEATALPFPSAMPAWRDRFPTLYKGGAA